MAHVTAIDDKKEKDIVEALEKIIEIQHTLENVVLLGTTKTGQAVMFSSPMFLRDQAMLAMYLNAYVSARFGIDSDL